MAHIHLHFPLKNNFKGNVVFCEKKNEEEEKKDVSLRSTQKSVVLCGCEVPVGGEGPSTDTASPPLFQKDDVESY